MNRKLIVLATIIIIAFGFTACSNDSGPATTSDEPIFYYTPGPTGQNTETDAATSSTVSGTGTAAPSPTSTGTASGVKMYVNIDSGSPLRVRSEASTEASILGVLTKNSVVLVVQKDVVSGWHKIQTNDGTIGYCSSEFLEETSATAALSDIIPYNSGTSTAGSSTNPGGSYSYIKVTVESGSLIVRASASTSSAQVGTLSNGQVVKATLNAAEGWHKVYLSNGTTGYVKAEFTTVTTGATATPTPKPTATPTPKPTATPTPTVSATATPTATPQE